MNFKGFGKIPRDNPFNVTITEKIDGTNACILIDDDGKLEAVQSRKRFITPEDDNFGFARWVHEHKEELEGLGSGYHYGEWAGPGIQKNHHNLKKKTFLLFNTYLKDSKPDCCETVPVLFEGVMTSGTVLCLFEDLLNNPDPDYTPEGVVVYYHTFKCRSKHTIRSPNGKWCK